MQNAKMTLGLVLSTEPSIGGGHLYESVLEEVIRTTSAKASFEIVVIRKQGGGYRLESPGPKFPIKKRFTLKVPGKAFRDNEGSLSAVVKDLSLDLIYFASPVQALAERLDIPYIATVWDLGFLELSHFPEFTGDYGRKMFDVLGRALPRAFRVVVESEATKTRLGELFGLDQSRVAVIGLPLPDLTTEPNPSLNIPEPYFVYPAKFWPHKNHQTLFDAFRQVLATHPSVCLVLTGIDADQTDAVRKRLIAHEIEQSTKVFGRLERTDLLAVIAKAQGLLMPTLLGPTNYPPLEAMGLGVPVLMSDVHKFDFDLPQSARLVPALEAKQWAREIVAILTNPPRRSTFTPPSVAHSRLKEIFLDFARDRKLWKD